MLDNEEIICILRNGVQKIISRATPPCRQDLCGKYRRSSHPTREFLFVIAGNGAYLCNDSVYPCTPGTLFLIDSGLPHGHRYIDEDNNYLHLWGYFHDRSMHLSIVEVLLHGQSRSFKGMSRFMMPEYITRLIESRWNMLMRCAEVTEQQVEDYMKIPVNAALDEMAFRIAEQSQELQKHTPLEDLIAYIRSQNGRECSLEHLAVISGYTKGYIAHKFRNELNKTVGEFINSVRLEYIRNALKRGIRQKEMAYELGFSSPKAFWNWYQLFRNQV